MISTDQIRNLDNEELIQSVNKMIGELENRTIEGTLNYWQVSAGKVGDSMSWSASTASCQGWDASASTYENSYD